MVLYGVLAIAMFVLCFATTRERVAPPAQQNSDLKRDLADLFGSRPWLVLVGVLLLVLAAFVIKGSASAYYFKYFVEAARDLLGRVPGLSNGLAFLVAVFDRCRALAKWFGKKRLFMMAIGVGGLVIARLLAAPGPSDIGSMFALQIVSSFIIGFNSPLVFAMFADTADDAEWRTGRRTTGLVFASAIFGTQDRRSAIGAWMFGSFSPISATWPTWSRRARSLHGIILIAMSCDSRRAAAPGRRRYEALPLDDDTDGEDRSRT